MLKNLDIFISLYNVLCHFDRIFGSFCFNLSFQFCGIAEQSLKYDNILIIPLHFIHSSKWPSRLLVFGSKISSILFKFDSCKKANSFPMVLSPIVIYLLLKRFSLKILMLIKSSLLMVRVRLKQ